MSYAIPARQRSLGLGTDPGAPPADEIARGRADAALARAAGVPVPVLRAIRQVESGGRSPSAIRFEPHLFHRETGDRFRAQVPYTPGTTGCPISRAASCIPSETNRAAFERAFALQPNAAVKSTSWGSYQVLGGRLLRIFDGDANRAVAEFNRNPAEVSDRLLVMWMSGNPVAQLAARTLNFGLFASRYNGCSDCAVYERRLRAAYDAALPEWRRVERIVGMATPGVIPSWVPWLVAGGVGVGVLGGATVLMLRSR